MVVEVKKVIVIVDMDIEASSGMAMLDGIEEGIDMRLMCGLIMKVWSG